jgi:hypothetical protein
MDFLDIVLCFYCEYVCRKLIITLLMMRVLPQVYAVYSTENPIYVFPEMKLRGFVPNSYTHVSVSMSMIRLQTFAAQSVFYIKITIIQNLERSGTKFSFLISK